MDAGQYVQTIEARQGLKVACLEEIGYRNGWVSTDQLQKLAETMKNTGYGHYLAQIIEEGSE